jgi:hypothetical protein
MSVTARRRLVGLVSMSSSDCATRIRGVRSFVGRAKREARARHFQFCSGGHGASRLCPPYILIRRQRLLQTQTSELFTISAYLSAFSVGGACPPQGNITFLAPSILSTMACERWTGVTRSSCAHVTTVWIFISPSRSATSKRQIASIRLMTISPDARDLLLAGLLREINRTPCAARAGMEPESQEQFPELETAVDQAIAARDGDLRTTVRSLVIANNYLMQELEYAWQLVSPGSSRRARTRRKSTASD